MDLFEFVDRFAMEPDSPSFIAICLWCLLMGTVFSSIGGESCLR